MTPFTVPFSCLLLGACYKRPQDAPQVVSEVSRIKREEKRDFRSKHRLYNQPSPSFTAATLALAGGKKWRQLI